MKAVLYIKPRKGKPHRAEDLSALGFRPALIVNYLQTNKQKAK